MLDEWQNVPESRVLRTLGQLGVFRRRQLALKSIQQAVQHKALPVIDRDAGVRLPESPPEAQHSPQLARRIRRLIAVTARADHFAKRTEFAA